MLILKIGIFQAFFPLNDDVIGRWRQTDDVITKIFLENVLHMTDYIRTKD